MLSRARLNCYSAVRVHKRLGISHSQRIIHPNFLQLSTLIRFLTDPPFDIVTEADNVISRASFTHPQIQIGTGPDSVER